MLYIYSWQAQGFYENIGYEVFSKFKYPDGPERIDMQKRAKSIMEYNAKSIYRKNAYRKSVLLFWLFLIISLSACTALASTSGSVENQYMNPEDSGLLAAHPYPSKEDICISLNSNAVTKPFEMTDHFLIACPQHEVGAIEDRKREQNAEILGLQNSWTILRVNNSFRTSKG